MSEAKDTAIVYAGSYVGANFLKGLLEDAGIRVFLWGDHISGSVVGPRSGVQVAIATRDLDEAKPIVQQFLDEKLFEEGPFEDPSGLPW